MLLTYTSLVELVTAGVINAPMENINGASIDITLGDTLMAEEYAVWNENNVVDLAAKESIVMKTKMMNSDGYVLYPGDFILGNTQETFNLPNNIACEYRLKSSLGRNGLDNVFSGWCDPGWNGSKFTLQLHNVLRRHGLLLKPGMKIGQMIFWECDPVPDDKSYAAVGQYNNDNSVTQSKGVR